MSQILRGVKNATLEDELAQKTHMLTEAANERERLSVEHRREEEEANQPSDELHNRLDGIIAAKSLEAFGLYDKLAPHENGPLPDLPRRLQMIWRSPSEHILR